MGGAMGKSDKTPRRSATKARCAIYTRKSSEEGLEQAFNSLDAQREACAAFILSQKHEGWTVVPTLYDDGGFSGGTMERPALKRLIARHRSRHTQGTGPTSSRLGGPYCRRSNLTRTAGQRHCAHPLAAAFISNGRVV
jgi:Resolvase, N terminal domain